MGIFRQFPYSNFHEMNMDEIIKIVKNMLEEWATYHAEWDNWMNEMNEDWTNYQDVMNKAWQNMQDFINNYFDNLDVQEEVNNKIVSMVQTGEFDSIVNEYIPPSVQAWLNANITQPVGVVIDRSLTVQGACADAKATGDGINDVKNDLGLDYSYSTDATFVLKHITSDGILGDNDNKNAVFAVPLVAMRGSTVYVDNGYKFELGLYNIVTGAFIERVDWMTSKYIFDDDYLVRIEISDTSESVLVDTSISTHLHYTLISQIFSPVKRTVINFDSETNINLNYEVGDVVSITPEYVPSYRHTIITCKENDIFIINATGGYNPRVWGFIDADNKLISVASANTASQAQTNLMLIAPEGSANLIINDQRTGGECVKYSFIETNKYWIDYIRSQLEIYALKEQVEAVTVQANNVFKGLGIEAFIGKTVNITSPNKYNAWPFIGTVDGKLICVYSRGLSHSDGATPAIYAKTSENGVVWSIERSVIDTEGIRDTVTGKGNTEDGDFIFWDRVGQPGSGSESFHLYKTEDGITFDLVSSPSFSILPAHIGDIINVPTVGLMTFFNTLGVGTRTWGKLVSTDNGETWTQTSIESAIAGTDCPTEISAVYLGNGKILAIGRKDVVGDTTNAFFQMQSNDYGVTWSKAYTNIIEIAGNQPSLVYDTDKDELSLYYYYRGSGALWKLTVDPDDVWNNPTNWHNGEIIAEGSTIYDDAGQVNATIFNDIQIVTFYSGDPTNTGIYATITD